MDTIGEGPAILHLRTTLALSCMQSRILATRSYEIRYGQPFSANRACRSSIPTVLYTLAMAITFNVLRKTKCRWDFASKNSTETRKINAAALELVGLRPKPPCKYWVSAAFVSHTSARAPIKVTRQTNKSEVYLQHHKLWLGSILSRRKHMHPINMLNLPIKNLFGQCFKLLH